MREDDGGMGGDAFDTLIVMEAFGRALVSRALRRDRRARGAGSSPMPATTRSARHGFRRSPRARSCSPSRTPSPAPAMPRATWPRVPRRQGGAWKPGRREVGRPQCAKRRRARRERAHLRQGLRSRRHLALPRGPEGEGRVAAQATRRRTAGAPRKSRSKGVVVPDERTPGRGGPGDRRDRARPSTAPTPRSAPRRSASSMR